MKMDKKNFREGMKHGLPIGLGYFAVAFSLGIVAQSVGLTPFQGFLGSVLNHASAGEYAMLILIGSWASFPEVFLMSVVANARYLLMSCALSQRFSPETGLLHRICVGWGITDEIFGITIARSGFVRPEYTYGAMCVATPLWALGTMFGIIAGNILPMRIVSALSVALYGMFIAIIIPPAKKDRVVLGMIIISFVLSFVFGIIPILSGISSGTKTIILTVLIAGIGAVIFPIKEDEEQ